MQNFFSSLIVIITLFFSLSFSVQAKIDCEKFTNEIPGRIGEVVKVKLKVVLPNEMIILVTANKDSTFSDNIFPIAKLYTPQLYKKLKTENKPIFLYVGEGKSQLGDRTLWMTAVINGKDGKCELYGFGDRVYLERFNYPYDSYDEIYIWEQKYSNPKSKIN